MPHCTYCNYDLSTLTAGATCPAFDGTKDTSAERRLADDAHGFAAEIRASSGPSTRSASTAIDDSAELIRLINKDAGIDVAEAWADHEAAQRANVSRTDSGSDEVISMINRAAGDAEHVGKGDSTDELLALIARDADHIYRGPTAA